jgi:hypothetical protein
MTLFSNILQNPLDPRAKSDTRLMDLVVTFLSMLGQEAEQGGVHRMLGICSEFVRISKVVIERAEKEQSSRRKRKNADSGFKPVSATGFSSKASATAPTPLNDSPSVETMETPRPVHAASSAPTPRNHSVSSTHQNAMGTNTSPSSADRSGSLGRPTTSLLNGQSPPDPSSWRQDMQPHDGDMDLYNNMNAFGVIGVSPPAIPLTARPFTQPLLPQDLFGLPATLDWNWAEMSGGAYPSVENGNFGGEQEDMSEQLGQ